VFVFTSNDKGNIAEAEIAAAATRLGINVLKPLLEHGRYDLAFDLGDRILRVQCKWARRAGDVVIDAVAAYCDELDTCYLMPAEMIAGMSAVQLRLAAPKNGQRACLNWARDHELDGAIAQLGERRRGTAEVAGSSPASSTVSPVDTLHANDFRRRFGWYMERAAAGDSFLITRRGKPYARLSPPFEQLGLEEPEPAEVIPIAEAGGASRPGRSAESQSRAPTST
jgi:prevent-host-death family protein